MPKARHLGRVVPALALILVIAAVARYWGIGFGLPHVDARPDETAVMNVAVGFFTGDPNPHVFTYPTLYMYCLSGVYLCYYLWGLLSGKYLSVSDLAAEYAADPANFFVLDRALSALAGTATVLIVYWVARRLAGRRAALIASAFLALSHLHVRDSHFGVTDVAATLLIMCSMVFILRSYDDKAWGSYLAAGAFAGLAAATKYAGALLVVPMVIVHVLNSAERKDGTARSLFDKRILLFLGGLALAFLIGSPFVVLDFHAFANDFGGQLRHVKLGHKILGERIILGRGWWYHLRFSLPLGLGWSLFLASLAGIPVLLRQSFRKGIVFCAFPLAYYALVGGGYTVFLRYVIPLVPFLCITGAVCAAGLSDGLHRRLRLPSIATSVVVSSLVILPSAISVVRSDWLLGRRDNRLLAVDWVTRNIPAESSVFLTGPIWREHTTCPPPGLLEARHGVAGHGAGPQEARAHRSVEDSLPRHDRWTYDAASGRFERQGEAIEGLPQYILVRESPLLERHGPPQGILELLESSYRLRRSFRALDMSRDHYRFDMLDGFFVPFAGFAGVERPGPNIHIYERAEAASG